MHLLLEEHKFNLYCIYCVKNVKPSPLNETHYLRHIRMVKQSDCMQKQIARDVQRLLTNLWITDYLCFSILSLPFGHPLAL